MNLSDYLLDHCGRDWATLLAGWADLLPSEFTVWMVNRFGDVIAVLDDGSVHLLDSGNGTFEQIGDDRKHFAELMDIEKNANVWLMIPLVDDCVNAGMELAPDQCYGFKLAPLLGGEYAVRNVAPISLAENLDWLSDLWRQTRDLPDGSRVRLVVKRRQDA
jgi:hypothetical protein